MGRNLDPASFTGGGVLFRYRQQLTWFWGAVTLSHMCHGFWLGVYNNAPTIQVVVAIAGSGLLIWYAIATQGIWNSTLAQSVASRRPYFHAEDWENKNKIPEFSDRYYYQFNNTGPGIALNVRWRYLNDPTGFLIPIGSCGVGRVKFLFDKDQRWIDFDEITKHEGVYLEYEDTAKRCYWTTIKVLTMADDTIHTLVDTGSLSKARKER